MYPLTEILSPSLPQSDLIALNPAWTRADFNRAVFALSGRLKNENVQTAALWFEDAAQFACALLAVWHSGADALLLPNLADDNLAWAATADIVLTDCDKNVFSDGLNVCTTDFLHARPSENETLIPVQTDIAPAARAFLKTSGSGGEAQIIAKTAAQMEAESLALAAEIPFGKSGATVIGSVLPQHMYGFTFRFALSLTLGWTMVRAQAVYPESLLGLTMPSEKAVWIASPAVLNRLGEQRNWTAVAGKVIGIVSAGGALPSDTADLLAQKTVRPYEIYGSTETGVIASRRDSGLWQPFAAVAIAQDHDGALAAQSPWTDGLWQSADLIERDTDGFTLLGRKDRIIKFEDKRVSLTQIEHELLRHPWIADAHSGQHPQHRRIAVWAALNSDGIAALRAQGRAAVADALKKHLAAGQDKTALPRYWRFTAELPRNAQAKITAADFQTAFTVPHTEPVWQAMPSENGASHLFQGRVPLDLAYFGGHFAEFPLVPGVIELQWIRSLAARFDWGAQDIVRIENLKYQQFIRPNDEMTVSLAYDGDKNKLSFKISHGDAACASGRIVFGAFEAV